MDTGGMSGGSAVGPLVDQVHFEGLGLNPNPILCHIIIIFGSSTVQLREKSQVSLYDR